GRGLTPARAQEAFVDLEDLGIIWYSERALLREAWGMRDRASAYDAIYLALARALSLPGQGVRVLILDERLARACPDLTLVPSVPHADRPSRAHGAPGLGVDSSMSLRKRSVICLTEEHHMTTRRALLGLAGLAGASALAGCSADPEIDPALGPPAEAGLKDEITFGIWDKAQEPAMLQIVEAFNQHYPDISVSISTTAFGPYFERLRIQATG